MSISYSHTIYENQERISDVMHKALICLKCLYSDLQLKAHTYTPQVTTLGLNQSTMQSAWSNFVILLIIIIT